MHGILRQLHAVQGIGSIGRDRAHRVGRINIFDGSNFAKLCKVVDYGIFHDIIYLSIDQQLTLAQQEILAQATGRGGLNDYNNDTESDKGKDLVNSLLRSSSTSDPVVQMVRTIFDCSQLTAATPSPANQPLSTQQRAQSVPLPLGTNEYLSAFIAAKVLEGKISFQHLIQVVACIEASIPFRSSQPQSDGTTGPMERLYQRLEQFCLKDNRSGSTVLTPHGLVETVQMAAFFANCDLRAFRDTAVVFFNSTWSLLPEWKPALLGSCFSLEDFRDALLLLQQRYQSTPHHLIFQSFRGTPSSETMQRYRKQAV